jgi:hypothetical protein
MDFYRSGSPGDSTERWGTWPGRTPWTGGPTSGATMPDVRSVVVVAQEYFQEDPPGSRRIRPGGWWPGTPGGRTTMTS